MNVTLSSQRSLNIWMCFVILLASCSTSIEQTSTASLKQMDHDEAEAEDQPLLMSYEEEPQLMTRAYALNVPGPWAPPQRTLDIAATQSVQVVNAPNIEPDGSCSSNNPFACSCSHPACSPGHPGTIALKDYIVNRYSFARNLGVYCCRQNSGAVTVPQLSVHAIGRAIDIGIPVENGDADNGNGDQIANWLVENAEFIGIQRVIWDHRYWNGQRGFGDLNPNTAPHTDHIHIELSIAGAARQTAFFQSGAINGSCDSGCVDGRLVNSDCTTTDCAAIGSVCLGGGTPRCGESRNDPFETAQRGDRQRLPGVSAVGGPKKVSFLNQPRRIFDTRQDSQSSDLVRGNGSRSGPLSNGGPNVFNSWSGLSGEGVWLNYTVIAGDSGGFSTVYSGGGNVPDVSNINFAANEVRANSVAVMKGAQGVAFNISTPSHGIADVAALFSDSGLKLTPLAPRRVIDTRASIPVSSETVLEVNPQLPADAEGVIFTLTAVPNDDNGFLTAFPCGQEVPNASNLNYKAHKPVANSVISKLGGGRLCIYSYGETNVLVDVTGYFSSNGTLSYQAVTPVRVVDTRSSNSYYSGRLGSRQVIEIPLQSLSGMPSNIWAATLNLTSLDQDERGFMTTFPCADQIPNTSSINFVGGEVVAAGVTVPVSTNGSVCIYSFARSNLIVDLNGVWVNQGNNQRPEDLDTNDEPVPDDREEMMDPNPDPDPDPDPDPGTDPETDPGRGCECVTGTIGRDHCGACNFRVRECLNCHWEEWSECQDLSICEPDEVNVRTCCSEMGSQRQVCNEMCQWSEWGTCFDQESGEGLSCDEMDQEGDPVDVDVGGSEGCAQKSQSQHPVTRMFFFIIGFILNRTRVRVLTPNRIG